ncbi:hypothetical protein WMY93_020589 [Mugilogobius chulae]|uniref:Uncharacterized protein n=1 Tax=Mugilogobius chulae TaxID=88201 RepID=A0AAW0NIC9_9GOBI
MWIRTTGFISVRQMYIKLHLDSGPRQTSSSDIHGLCADIQKIYDELRRLTPPDQETRRKVDLCVEISRFIVERGSSRIKGQSVEEEQDWPDAGSLFQSTVVSKSHSSTSKKSTAHSSRSSVKHQEAAAEAAASQAVLIVLQEQEREQQEIDRLEVEVRRKAAEQGKLVRKLRLEREAEELKLRMQRESDEAKMKAQQEEEYAALQSALDERKRKLLHLEKVKDLKAAQARMQVYRGGASLLGALGELKFVAPPQSD